MAKMIWRPSNPENANDGQAVVGEQGQVATDSAGRDDKLEIHSDGSWFAAELTLREDGTTNVHFDGFSVEDDDQWDAEKIKSLNPINKHIRVVSEQLQDEECGIVNVNKIVCALRRARDYDGWHDAVVVEMRKRPHTFGDEGETCTCSFAVTWRDGPAKGLTERDLTCAEICLLSTKNVETHPLVVDILRLASGEGRGMDQEREGPSSSAPRVSRSKGDTDDGTDASEEQVYSRRRLKRLKPNDVVVSEAEDSLDQSELLADDHIAGTASTQSEFRDVPSLSSRSAELCRDNSLSSHSAMLIREMTAEICAGVNHLKQSKQAVEATQYVPPPSSPAASNSDRPMGRISVDHLQQQSKEAVQATQDVPPLSSPAAGGTSRPMKRMSVDHLKQSKQAVEATQDVPPVSSPAAADSTRSMKKSSVDHLKQSKQAMGTTQDVPPVSSRAAAESSRPTRRTSVDHLKQSKQAIEATQDVPPVSSPAAADSTRSMKKSSVDHLKQSKQAMGTTQDVPPVSSRAAAESSRPTRRTSVDHLKQSKQAVENAQDVPPVSSPAAADSNRPMRRTSVDHSKQSKQAVETTQDVPPVSSPAATESTRPRRRTSVDHLKQSNQAVETTQDVPPLSSPAAGDSNRPKKKMRGQAESEESFPSDLSDQRERIFGTKSSEGVCKEKEQQRTVSMDAKSLDSQTQRKPTISGHAKPVEDRRVDTKVFLDLTEEAECEFPVKKETVEAKSDSLEERHLSRPFEAQVKEEVKAKADFRVDHHLSIKPPDESGGNDGVSKLLSDLDIKETEAKADPVLELKRAGSLPETVQNVKARSEAFETVKKIENLAAKSDGKRSKKVRITVEFDMELDESASIVEGLSLGRSFPAGAKVTSYSPNYEEELLDSGGKSRAMATTCKPVEPKPEASLSGPADCPPPERNDEKFCHVSVVEEKGSDNRREEELPGSVDESFGGPKQNDPSDQPKVEDESKFVMYSSSRARPGNEQELVDSKSRKRLGSALCNAICLSDEEEEDGVTADSSIPPTSSTREFSSSNLSGSDHASTDDHEEGWNVHLRNNQARNRSAFIKNVLARSGCILVIDNLEIGVRESDLREQLVKFCKVEKILSVRIPPPHPELNRSTGYVIFSDKEAANTVAGILASCVIVSGRGRPWVVRTQGQEEPDLRKSDLMGDVLDGNARSTENFKVLTEGQLSEYNAARKRQRVFNEHLKQTRVMFQRHAQEEKKMDATRTFFFIAE